MALPRRFDPKKYKVIENNHPRKIIYAMLSERTIPEPGANSMFDVSMNAGRIGAGRIGISYARTDYARDTIVAQFLEITDSDKDTLIMFDDDHIHHPNTIERLVAHDKGVVGALAFRRGTPYFPCAFNLDENGRPLFPRDFNEPLMKVDVLGFAAVAIQRWVFGELIKHDFWYPWFRYEYPNVPMNKDLAFKDGVLQPHIACGRGYQPPSEDIYFNKILSQCQVDKWCDTTLIAPHITVGVIDDKSWKSYVENHQDDPNMIEKMAMQSEEKVEV